MFRRWILVLAALAVAACDVPTQPPAWEQTWMVPGEEMTVGVSEVLPAGVSVSADGSAFQASVPGAGVVVRLGDACPDCSAFDGLTVAKPAFSHTVTMATSLPAAVVAASLTGDRFALDLEHDLSFDPLRPGSGTGAERGYVVIEVTSQGAIVARDSISGNDQAFPAGVSLGPVLPIRQVDVAGSMDISMTVYSPAGDPVEIDTSDTLGIRLRPAVVSMSRATIAADDIGVTAVETELDLTGVDPELVSRVQSGALRLDISNPFEVEGTLSFELAGGSSTFRRDLALVPGASSVSIEFTGDEVRDLLDAGAVTLNAAGTLSAPGGTLTVAPGDTLLMDSFLELVLLVGGSEGESR